MVIPSTGPARNPATHLTLRPWVGIQASEQRHLVWLSVHDHREVTMRAALQVHDVGCTELGLLLEAAMELEEFGG